MLGSSPVEGKDYPLHYSCLEFHGLYSPQGHKSWARLSDVHIHFFKLEIELKPWISLVLQFADGSLLDFSDSMIMCFNYHDKSHPMSINSVQLLSGVWLFETQWTAACQASLSITDCWSLLKLKSIELVMPSNHLNLCDPLLLPPSIIPSIRVFSNKSVLCIRWPQYCSFSFTSVLPMDIQDWFPLGWTVGPPCSPRDSQESSPTPQFKTINSSVISFLYSPTLTSIHD